MGYQKQAVVFMTSKNVVVGIDGAPDCENAIRWGAAEAAARGVALRLVHAFVWPMFRGVPLGPTDIAPGMRAYADRLVASAVELAQKFDSSVQVTAHRVDGFPAPVLLAESRTAGLIVIGSRAAGRFSGLLLSSTGVELSAHAHCPVVVARRSEDLVGGRRVVIGYDGSPAAGAAVDFGLAYARRHGLAARIVAVLTEDGDQDVTAAVRANKDARTTEVVEVVGHPAELLLEWSTDAQLLVVGSRGHGGFAGLLLGSVSQTMLHQSPCPVAVIPTAAIEGHLPG